MFRPSTHKTSSTDLSSENIWAEIDFAAMPHLRAHLKDDRTKVRLIDLSEHVSTFFATHTPDEFRTFLYLTPGNFSKLAMQTQERGWQVQYQLGKTLCHIHGIDKPLIGFDGRYYFQFHDCTGHAPTEERVAGALRHQVHEMFYWTPDLPQIVIKQCQLLKAVCERELLFKMFMANASRYSQDYARVVNKVIYDDTVNSVNRRFQTGKMRITPVDGADKWFHAALPKEAGGFKELVQDITRDIADKFFMGTDAIYNGEPGLVREKRTFKVFKARKHYL